LNCFKERTLNVHSLVLTIIVFILPDCSCTDCGKIHLLRLSVPMF